MCDRYPGPATGRDGGRARPPRRRQLPADHCRNKFRALNVCLSLPFVPTASHPEPCPVPSCPSHLLLSVPVCLCSCSHLLHPHSPPRCCLAPASAAKFPEAVLAAGLTPETPAEILALEHKETRCTPMRKGDDWTWMLRDAIQDLSQQWRGHFPKALA